MLLHRCSVVGEDLEKQSMDKVAFFLFVCLFLVLFYFIYLFLFLLLLFFFENCIARFNGSGGLLTRKFYFS